MHEISLYEQILQSNIINFLIVLYILVLICKKIRIGEIIGKMAEDVKTSVETSSEKAKIATEEYEKVKDSVKDTSKLQEQILAQAKLSAINIKKKIELKTVTQVEELKSSLERTFKSQFEKYKHLTTDEVYQASINLAKEEVLKRLDKTTHKKLIDLSIDELDKIEGNLS